MLRHITFVLRLCAAAALAAALLPRLAEAITFGEIDTGNQFSNVGANIVINFPPGSQAPPFVAGSGTLIHPRVLLTAGHVTAQAEEVLSSGLATLDNVRVSFGVDAFDDANWVEIEAFITHPDFAFHPDASSQDVGVIILKKPVRLPCATLAYEGLLDDLQAAGVLREEGVPEQFVAVGYGATLDFPPPEQETADGLRRFVFADYRALDKNWLVLNQNPATGNGGGAPGDSGGPVFWVSPGGDLILVGIASRTDAQRISLFEACRTDTAGALDFIDSVLALVKAKSH